MNIVPLFTPFEIRGCDIGRKEGVIERPKDCQFSVCISRAIHLQDFARKSIQILIRSRPEVRFPQGECCPESVSRECRLGNKTGGEKQNSREYQAEYNRGPFYAERAAFCFQAQLALSFPANCSCSIIQGGLFLSIAENCCRRRAGTISQQPSGQTARRYITLHRFASRFR